MQIRPARAGEYDEVLDLVRKIFGDDDEAWVLVSATVSNDARFSPEHLRVAERDGQIVGMINIIDRIVRVGTAQVRCAIVAPLGTLPEQQGTGVGSALMRDTLGWAREHGFHLSMLWGHTWLYPRYGYAPGIKSYEVVFDAQAHPLGDGAYTLRPYAAPDTPALRRTYEAETALTTLAELRSDDPWEWRPFRPETRVEVAVDPARAIRGYLRASAHEGRLNVGEVATLDINAAQAIYDRMLSLARDVEATTIHVTATPDSRWTRLAFRNGAQVRVGSGGGHGMVRLLDLPSFLEAIRPELTRRVARSEFVSEDADLRIETPVGNATLRVRQGAIEIGKQRAGSSLALPFHALGPLITGYQPIDELIGLPGVFMHGTDRRRLIDVLFPEGYPHWPFAAYFS